MSNSIITITTAPAGSGKTYSRCAKFIFDEWLADKDNAIHFSNFPIKMKMMVSRASKKYKKPLEEIQGHLEILPDEVYQSWVQGTSGPWEFFKEIDLESCHLAIDEAHNVIGKNKPKEVKENWRAWLSEIRHLGATIEFLTQHPNKLAKEIHEECAKKIMLNNAENLRDPWFKIINSDWFELKAKFLTGEYTSYFLETEYQERNGRFRESNKKLRTMSPYYFDLYDSFSTPQGGGKKANVKKHKHQLHSWYGLLWWFYKRNWYPVTLRLGIGCLVMGIFLGGGIGFMIKKMTNTISPSLSGGFERNKQEGKKDAITYSTAKNSKKSSIYLSQEVKKKLEVLKKQNEKLQEEKGALLTKNRKLSSDLNRINSVVLLTPDSVTLNNGKTWLIGEKIRAGNLKGLSITKIVWLRREIYFNNGLILEFGNSATSNDNSLAPGRLPARQGTRKRSQSELAKTVSGSSQKKR